MKTRTYVTFLVSGALALLAFGATMIVHGGWQAAAAAFAVLTGGAFLTSLISMRASAERLASPASRPVRRRAIARHAPAAEPRREATPAAMAPTPPARPEPRPRPRLSSNPS
jgi:hypothetical protein